jgi:RHS repeat-associated protein
LPQLITFTGNRTIAFVYDASGAKLQKITTDNGGTPVIHNYIGGVEYIGNTLERLPHAEGEIVNKDGAYVYEYALKDHLGNTRVTFTNTPGANTLVASDIKQINSYYPFGLNMEGPGFGAQGTNKYQFGGKELNSDFGLNWNDYGARFYDPAIGRFSVIDRFSKKYQNLTPYQYTNNNPIRFIDVNGDSIKPGEGQRAEFVAEFMQVIKKLKEKGEDGPYQQMESSKTNYKLVEESGTSGAEGSRFDPKTNTLHWNPRVAYFFDETFVTISPATVLSHELDHGGRWDKDSEGMKADQQKPDARYSNEEEKRVITGSEQRVAKAFGEIKEGEVTRTDHLRATPIPVTGAFSTEPPTSGSETKIIKKN